MTGSIIPQLVKKDLLILRKTIVFYALVSFLSIVVVFLLFGKVSNVILMNIAFTLMLAPAATCGIVMLMRTNVMEKEKNTQLFIMSLPVSVKEFTWAKLLANLPVFSGFWLAVCVTAFYLVFGLELLPLGAIPFICILFLGVFVAYTCILCVSLVFQSLNFTVISLTVAELGTVAYLWFIALYEPINRHVYEPSPVWNTTAVSIVIAQIVVAVCMIFLTFHLQQKKRDFS